MELARSFLGDLTHGIEIGASSHNAFPGVKAWNVNLPGAEVYEVAQHRMTGGSARIDVFGTASRLPFGSGALGFVLNSHVVEHVPDTIGTLLEWDRVLQPGGVLFCIVPHKARTFDRHRGVTDVAHHLADHARRVTERTDSMVPGSHYHAWETDDFLALVRHLMEHAGVDWSIEAVEDVDSKKGNGFTVVLRKHADRVAPVDAAGPVAFHHLTLDLPFQVAGRTLEWTTDGATLPTALDLPRGTYRAVPIHAGFPPRAGAAQVLEVGDPVGPPRIESAHQDGGLLSLRGSDFHESTWFTAHFPGGVAHSVLPVPIGDELVVDLTGAVLPDAPFHIVPTNPAPGGGVGPAFEVRLSTELPPADEHHEFLVPRPARARTPMRTRVRPRERAGT